MWIIAGNFVQLWNDAGPLGVIAAVVLAIVWTGLSKARAKR
jgi:hypothetical protein